MKRVRWWDSDVPAQQVDAPDLPFRGHVNPNRVVVNHLKPPRKVTRTKNPGMTCR